MANATIIFPNNMCRTYTWLVPSNECFCRELSCYMSNTPNVSRINIVELKNNFIGGSSPSIWEG